MASYLRFETFSSLKNVHFYNIISYVKMIKDIKKVKQLKCKMEKQKSYLVHCIEGKYKKKTL